LIQPPQTLQRTIEDAIAALAIDILFQIARKRGDHFDSLLREKLRQVRKARCNQNGEIAAIDHAFAYGPRSANQLAKPGMHLRGATRDIERLNRRIGFENSQASLDYLFSHPLAAVWSRIDMTMPAGLIADFADIDLQDFDFGSAGRLQSTLLQQVGKLGDRNRFGFQNFPLPRGTGKFISRSQQCKRGHQQLPET
jgi:hypothetical protein